MASATAAPIGINMNWDDLKLAHDKAAQVMSQLSTETSIPAEDRRALQDFYNDLEQRQALLDQDTVSEESGKTESVKVEAKAKAVGFATFLASLDRNEAPTRLLVEGNNLVTIALGNIERGGNFLENAPVSKILDAYERIQSREEILKASGSPVSMVNAVIYLSEATAFSDMVKMLFVLDLDAPPMETSGPQ